MATVFVSPGVYTREQDFSVFAARVGVTKLGLIGETTKGPAFEPIKISSTDEYSVRFGTTNSRMFLPYTAKNFLSQSGELTITRVLGQEGFTNSAAWIISATGGAESGSTLAVLRSKSGDEGTTFLLDEESDLKIGAITGTLNEFVLSGTTGPLTAFTNGIAVSIDETRDNYIVKVLGKNPQKFDGDFSIYVETIYPHFVREASKRSLITSLTTGLTYTTDAAYTDYTIEYQTPVTPYVVTQVLGGEVKNLFRFHSISDGDSTNREIKISISNIDLVNKTFDVIIRDYNDTDATAFTTALERFRNVTLDTTKSNYIAKEIGTLDEEYQRRSNFVTIEMVDNHMTGVVPGGFNGYDLRSTAVGGTTVPDIFYKTEYFSGDTVTRTFLGISELGYTGHTASQVSYSKVINTLEHDLFTYFGSTSTGKTTVKGFHLESTADTDDFVVGVKSVISAYTKSQLKFTLVPAGGFDGWNKFRDPAFTTSNMDTSNVVAIKEAILTMANPEEVDINLLAVPGINYSDNEDVVKYALSMVEDRADTLYIMDSPRLSDDTAKGDPEDAVIYLQDTGIDSNYAATYWPWIQINDENTNKFVYVPPTVEVVANIAFTDNKAYPWFAPAGIGRGSLSNNVIRADIKLSKDDRDTLYDGRVNPIATFIQTGIVIWGQKTLQIRQSALDRVNVRRLLLQVRRLIAAASQTLVFEQNDQTLRDQFLSRVEPILLQIQNQRGLTAFRVVMDESNNTPEVVDRHMLVGKIQLRPTPTAEFIDLAFQVFSQGANFEG